MKKLGLQFLVLALLTLALQIPLGRLLDTRPFFERDTLDRALDDRVDIVYFGDSVLSTVEPGDRDTRDIARMVDADLDAMTVGLVQRPGYEMDIFASFVDYLARQPRRPRFLVVPLNLRSFSEMWPYSFGFDRLRLSLGDPATLGLYRPLRSLGLAPEEVLVTPARIRERPAKDLWKSAYMGTVDPKHERLASIRELAAVARKAGMTPVFYLTPINLDAGGQLHGAEFREKALAGAKVCADVAASTGFPVLDLSAALPDAGEFGSMEHLRDTGRLRVAAELAKALRALAKP